MGGTRRQLAPPPGRPAVVGDGVAGDLEQPGDEPLTPLDGGGVPMDAQKDILQDIVRICLTVHAARDEGPQALTKFRPDLLGVASLCRADHHPSRLAVFAYWHPQLSETPSPQQDAFSDGSQHAACGAGGQQLTVAASRSLPAKKRARFSGIAP